MILPENSTGLFVDRSILVLESKGLKLESSLRLCWLQQFERTTKEAIYASNKYLAEKLEISESKLSRLLKELEDFGLIERTVIRDPITKEVKKRLITTAPFLKLINGELKGIVTEGEQPKEEIPEAQPKKTENKDKPKQPKETENIPYQEIVDYLNEKANKKYSYKKASTQKDIKARFKEGYSLEDFKTVIDNKVHEWLGTDFAKYLRPGTLFVSAHFDDYLNQGLVPKQQDGQKKYPEQQPVQGNNKFDFGFVNPQ